MSKSAKLDVRMQISLSREHVRLAKKYKPRETSFSAYVREALEEKMSADSDPSGRSSKTIGEVVKSLSKPMKSKAPSVESLLAWEREMRRDKIADEQ